MDETGWKVVTRRPPADREWRDLRFAWAAAGAVKSNAILLARDEARSDRRGANVARRCLVPGDPQGAPAGSRSKGAVLASDAFFPFPDGVEEAARAGVRAIIQRAAR